MKVRKKKGNVEGKTGREKRKDGINDGKGRGWKEIKL